MKRKIFLVDTINSEHELVETFEGPEAELRARLLDLQKGYCEDEKPVLHEVTVPPRKSQSGKDLPEWTVLEAMSDSDYSYIARLR